MRTLACMAGDDDIAQAPANIPSTDNTSPRVDVLAWWPRDEPPTTEHSHEITSRGRAEVTPRDRAGASDTITKYNQIKVLFSFQPNNRPYFPHYICVCIHICKT